MTEQRTSTLTAELLPCPFCGGKPSSIILGMSICDGHQIVCENECAAGPFVDGKDEDEAAKLWNTRAPAQCAPEPANGLPTLDEYRNNLIKECAAIARACENGRDAADAIMALSVTSTMLGTEASVLGGNDDR